MQQSSFDFTGPQLSLIGQQLAIDSANNIIDNWSAGAYRLLIDYVKMYGSQPFKCEDVRSYAAEVDFPLPPHARAWGAILQRAKIDGVIVSMGTVKVNNPRAHSANANLWRRV